VSILIKYRSIRFIIPFILALFIILLSLYDNEWINFWNFLNVPAQYPPFADLDAINKALLSKQQGFDPFLENPNDIQNPKYMYPSVWLFIFEFFNLQDVKNFRIFNFIIIYSYFYILIDFITKIKSKKFFFILILFFLSTSNFLIIERLNIELIIFCLLYVSIVNKNIFLKSIIFLLSVIFKIFPIFSIFLFINKKKYFFLILFISILYFYLFRNEILIMRSNMIEYALIFAYGIGSISKAIYYYSMKFGYFINDNNYFSFRNLMILSACIYAILVFSIKFKLNTNIKKNKIELFEKFFLVGAGIYIGTFCTSANIDYRLIFLTFTIPFILEKSNKNLSILYFTSLVLCFNSLVLEGGNSYTLIYFIKASIIYLLKFIIFTINCYYFGEILNKYINIKFLNFKN